MYIQMQTAHANALLLSIALFLFFILADRVYGPPSSSMGDPTSLVGERQTRLATSWLGVVGADSHTRLAT